MTTISSKLTSVHKRVVPAIVFGVLLVFFLVWLIEAETWPSPHFVVVALVIGGVWVVVMKFLIWDLVDEVEDHGDYLVVRNRDEQDRILFTNITSVSGTMMVNPPRVTIRLARPGKFGDAVTFTPVMRFRFNPFAKPLIVDELRARVARARRG
jgi:hypothetical protein